jgi:CPA1 family monovalent cation:H+ antiporter
VLLGVGLGYGFAWLRREEDDFATEAAVSLALPFAVSLAATALRVNTTVTGVLTGVLTTLLVYRHAKPASRLQGKAFFKAVVMLVSGASTFLIALAFPDAAAGLAVGSSALLVGLVAGALSVALGVRFLLALVALPGAAPVESGPSSRAVDAALLTFAGSGRSLVAAVATLSLPLATPDGEPLVGRDLIVVVMFLLTLTSLAAQGAMAVFVTRRLGLDRDTGVADEEQEARVTLDRVAGGQDGLVAVEARRQALTNSAPATPSGMELGGDRAGARRGGHARGPSDAQSRHTPEPRSPIVIPTARNVHHFALNVPTSTRRRASSSRCWARRRCTASVRSPTQRATGSRQPRA